MSTLPLATPHGLAGETTPEALDEALIARLVHTFYARVREDAWLGPVFEARVENWEVHLARMCAFWSSVTLGSGRYQGQPMRKHVPLPVDGRHFDRWLALFEATAREVCPPEAAAIFLEKARRIAQSLELGIAGASGAVLQPGERLRRDGLEVPAEAPPTAPGRRLPMRT